MTLSTGLNHLATAEELKTAINENENVMVCCGRMGPMCVPVYGVMEELEGQYTNVKFFDMAFDSPEAHIVRNLPECQGFAGLPFTVYYKNGKVVKATSSIQDMDQVTEILDSEFKG
ncbi:MAG: thioredoxin family protein [Melioribacteraceae bacterium]|nr:thioredoxin family protein [Melioribacteraceae bacterium]